MIKGVRRPDSGSDAHYWAPTGWAEAVACLRLPQNVACRFPALRSSGMGSQHYESLQRPVGQPQSWSEQRDPLLEPIEGGQVRWRPAQLRLQSILRQ
jgi:hypothetical protein